MDEQQISGCQGSRVGEGLTKMVGKLGGEFWGDETTWYIDCVCLDSF